MHMEAVNTAIQLLSVELTLVMVIERVALKARGRIIVHLAILGNKLFVKGCNW